MDGLCPFSQNRIEPQKPGSIIVSPSIPLNQHLEGLKPGTIFVKPIVMVNGKQPEPGGSKSAIVPRNIAGRNPDSISKPN